MVADPADVVLDMLADTIDALNKGHSGDETVLDHLSKALEADRALSVYVDGADTFDLVAALPSTKEAQPLYDHMARLGAAAFPQHVTIEEVPGLGFVVFVMIRPDDDAAPIEGFGRIIALGRPHPFDPASRHILERTCRPLSMLWPQAAAAFAKDRAESIDFNITGRELQVLELLAKGLLATSIAARLDLSPRTVHKHLGNIYRKLGVHDRLVAVGIARAAGLLPASASAPNRGTPDPHPHDPHPASPPLGGASH